MKIQVLSLATFALLITAIGCQKESLQPSADAAETTLATDRGPTDPFVNPNVKDPFEPANNLRSGAGATDWKVPVQSMLTASDVDWWKIEVPVGGIPGGALFTLTTTPGTDLRAMIINTDNSTVTATATNLNGNSITIKLPPSLKSGNLFLRLTQPTKQDPQKVYDFMFAKL